MRLLSKEVSNLIYFNAPCKVSINLLSASRQQKRQKTNVKQVLFLFRGSLETGKRF